jgi:hypothetical protein
MHHKYISGRLDFICAINGETRELYCIVLLGRVLDTDLINAPHHLKCWDNYRVMKV